MVLGNQNSVTLISNKFRVFSLHNLDQIPQIRRLSKELRHAIQVVGTVMPFRVNQYVIDQLIDWTAVPNDPVFQLTFPQRGMLSTADFDAVSNALIEYGAGSAELKEVVHEIRCRFNPHPAGQQDLNVPVINGQPISGSQHKYDETVLFFPSQGQVCHAYCTFCFRWAQFVGEEELRFAANETVHLNNYLRQHKEVTDLLLTGGDPMVMRFKALDRYIRPLLEPELAHLNSVRIGTKSLSYWPQRFVTDSDADDVINLFKKVVDSGKHLTIMAHINHWQEMESPVFRKAVRRLRGTGAAIRTQSPLIAHINDDPAVWVRMWTEQVRLGMTPYYMFIERDTGAKEYFEVPLYRAWEIYREAIRSVSGLARTARGPSMSAGPGKIEISGVATINGEKVFVLRFIQGRNSAWVQQPFFAKYDEKATWLNDLKPAFGKAEFFYEPQYNALVNGDPNWKQIPYSL